MRADQSRTGSEEGSRTAAEIARWPWGRLVLAGNLAAFSIPALRAWRHSLDDSAHVPLVALAASAAIGLCMLLPSGMRWAAARVLGATAWAASLELVLTVVLVIAYSQANPGWDLS